MSEHKKDSAAKTFGNLEPRTKLIVDAGAVGIILLAVSGILPDKTKPKKTTDGISPAAEYASELEARIYDIVSNIDGAGKTKVMITLENSVEYVYALQEKTTTDSTQNIRGPDEQNIDERTTSEKGYIFVENENGRKQALVETTLEPRIKGVVILCEGAGNAVVEFRVLNAVTTALDISGTKVCITKIGK